MGCGLFANFFRKRNAPRKPLIRKEADVATSSSTHIASGKTECSADRYENGRRYNNRADVAYVLPIDEEENDRVHQQHWLVKITFGGNFSAPIADELEKGIVVQDAGCGPGTWTLDMANAFPRSTFYGTDVSSRFPQAIKPGNCHFHVHNLVDEGVFPENYFNFIHQRLLVLGILKNDWEKVIREHVRNLVPGGWLECTELAFYRAHNSGPNYAVLADAWVTMCNIKGLYADIPDHLEELFKNVGLINIECKEADGPMNPYTQYGKLAAENFKEVFHALKPVIVLANPELNGDDKFLEFLESCLNEFTELGTRQTVYRIWGQKPLEPREHSNQ